MESPEDMLRASDVAARFGVTKSAVNRWTEIGLLKTYRTPGGHRRYRRRDVDELWEATQSQEWTRENWNRER